MTLGTRPQDTLEGFGGQLVLADVVDEARRTRHDPVKLANALVAILRSP